MDINAEARDLCTSGRSSTPKKAPTCGSRGIGDSNRGKKHPQSVRSPCKAHYSKVPICGSARWSSNPNSTWQLELRIIPLRTDKIATVPACDLFAVPFTHE